MLPHPQGTKIRKHRYEKQHVLSFRLEDLLHHLKLPMQKKTGTGTPSPLKKLFPLFVLIGKHGNKQEFFSCDPDIMHTQFEFSAVLQCNDNVI